MPFEHSRKQQNVDYTDATIGCSLKQPKMGSEPILSICVCIAIDAMLNFDFDVDANAKVIRKQGYNCIKTLTLQHCVQYIRFYRYRWRTP